MKFGKDTERAIREAVEGAVKEALGDATKALAKLKTIRDLKEQIENLEIEKGKIEWNYDKREMELEHKIGLERKRQEFEVGQAKREAVVTLKEENLTADKERFEKEMTFIRERFEKEVGYLKDILTEVLRCVKGEANDSGHGDD